jgi:hypothetical protein
MRTLLLILLCTASSLHAQVTRVLFIGNSYTYSNDLPGLFTQLAGSMGRTVETGMVAPGGFTFEGHTTNAATLNAIDQGDWDVVVLQEQSQRPAFPPAQVAQDVYPYAAQLVERIEAANACTRSVFLMTWGRENGDQQNCASYPPLCTYAGMQQRLWESYVAMAQDNEAIVAPAGAVWRAYRNAHPTAVLYTDGSHPNLLGSYIAATTLYSAIFDQPTTGSTLVPGALDPADAAEVRDLASAIVADSAATWNLNVYEPVAEADLNYVGGTSVLFSNNTSGATQQEWHFGDGATSTDVDPLHSYATAGAYTVTLIVSDACGRSDSTQLEVDLLGARVSNVTRAPSVRIGWMNEQLLVFDLAERAMLRLTDAQGRLVFERLVHAADRQVVNVPAVPQGPMLWQVSGGPGGTQRGVVVALP